MNNSEWVRGIELVGSSAGEEVINRKRKHVVQAQALSLCLAFHPYYFSFRASELNAWVGGIGGGGGDDQTLLLVLGGSIECFRPTITNPS